MNDKIQILFESLRRTDSYILAADQKSSFCLAAGITFLGIYATLFFSVISDEKNITPTALTCTILGMVLFPWCVFFYKIKNVFSPNLEPSNMNSIVSFASMRAQFNSFELFKTHFMNIKDNDYEQVLLDDILENHWICSGICSEKMKKFKSSLFWLWIALAASLLGLATLIFFKENSEFVYFLSICK
ncbi:hypothetical protein [Vibrio vulnificus]|uniref:hypothetical protein n=1 Tax=Vibrio vulnificus TaxID=672 RepID=UPI00188CF901|nr:hypothetical protein [Vibrio vulnificus]MBF4450140.1 hypothetical protein [Vibrio vulnificus]MBF4497420.1 hypothetical protein [Vibrio vulnificus]MBL6178230.1 hypothetical protein [Vibrio vulnificus]HDY7980297.1 hypothetical protein [Vibrio vulnificus]HDY8003758.1 hypothetical protein [Vibrio vulnificus]